MNLIDILKAIADENRIRIINLLSNGEFCVYEIEHLLKIGQSNASRQLNKLTVAGLVKNRKKSLFVYYSLNDTALEEHTFLVELIKNETMMLASCKEDIKRLNKYRASGLSCLELKERKQ